MTLKGPERTILWEYLLTRGVAGSLFASCICMDMNTSKCVNQILGSKQLALITLVPAGVFITISCKFLLVLGLRCCCCGLLVARVGYGCWMAVFIYYWCLFVHNIFLSDDMHMCMFIAGIKLITLSPLVYILQIHRRLN